LNDTNPFATKSTRLARRLLSCPDRSWKQAELVEQTGLNAGLVSRLLNHFVRIGWATGQRADWRLTDPDALLDAWAEADDWAKRTTLFQYSTLERDLDALARRTVGLPGVHVALTQWFAAQLRYAYAEVPVVSAYVDRLPGTDALEELGFNEVLSGGRVWLILPDDPGVFQAGQVVNDLPLVSDVQIYLDLLQVGLRGPDQAKALREWSGFRR